MSRARLVITAVVVEGRKQAEVARSYGVSHGWVSKLVARYRLEGEAAYEPRPRRGRGHAMAWAAGRLAIFTSFHSASAGAMSLISS